VKYISYFFMAIFTTCLVIPLSLSSCSSDTKVPVSQPPTPTHQVQAQPQGSSQKATATVKIHNFKFEPANVAIAVEETVQFVNTDEEPHTATATDGTFDSKGLDTDRTWNYTATKPGTFPYICSIHPFMKGTLTVTPKKT
jgi:plastocyanin